MTMTEAFTILLEAGKIEQAKYDEMISFMRQG